MEGGCWEGKQSGEPLKVPIFPSFLPFQSILVWFYLILFEDMLQDKSVSKHITNLEVILLRRIDKGEPG